MGTAAPVGEIMSVKTGEALSSPLARRFPIQPTRQRGMIYSVKVLEESQTHTAHAALG